MMWAAINVKSSAPVKQLLTAPHIIVLCMPMPAEAVQSKMRAILVNTDDMWVASPLPELPPGVTHHTFRSDSMRRDVGYYLYLPPSYERDKV